MEPLTTAVMISSIVTYLGVRLSKDKSVDEFLSDLTKAAVSWIRPLFLNDDGSEKEVITQLKEKADSPARQKAVESVLEVGLEETPAAKQHIKEIFEKISKTKEGAKIINNITNSKNVNTGNVNTGGGNFRLGDNK
ncbi:MAG: hypothetical protein HOO91_14360 [Bacteroidales bacterium]|nr:hypothetical protein [Bacteroidales bacterium]